MGQRASSGSARSATRTGPLNVMESRQGPSPRVNWSSSYMRAGSPLDPSVPLVAPSNTREIAAASISKSTTQASHSRSAASTPRRPSTAARSWSWIATFNRTRVGQLWHFPAVEVARSYLHLPPVARGLRGLAAPSLRQDRALPLRHSAHGTVQSPFCDTFNGGPPVLCTSTTSPGTEKSKNHLAFSPLRFRQPWLVSVLPCAHTVALSWCRYMPSLL